MSLSVVVGGQFGSEGKGKVCAHLATHDDVDIMIRCGGPNSGHTVARNGDIRVMRCLPAGVVNARTRLAIAAGALIDLNVFFAELESCAIDPSRVAVDRNAGIIDWTHKRRERASAMRKKIGSTLSGVGAAISQRVMRQDHFALARDIPDLAQFVTDVAKEANEAIEAGQEVVIEGTQGLGLSLWHSPYYPYTTSRDTTVSGFLSEVGVSPLKVDEVIMVLRTFPIRVGGNSGPLPNEINWHDVQKLSGYPYQICEYTSVTKRLRRVGRFDWEIVKRAAAINRPTQIALMGVDYLDYANKGVKKSIHLTSTAKALIRQLEQELNAPVTLIGTGPDGTELIDRRVAPMQFEDRNEGH